MEFERKQLRDWLPWLVAVLVLGLFLTQLHFALNRSERDWQEHLFAQKTVIEQSLKTQQELAIQQASVVAHLIAKDPNLVTLIQQEVRKARPLPGAVSDPAAENELPSPQAQSTTEKTQVPPLQQKLGAAVQAYWSTLSQMGATHLTLVGANDGQVFYRAHQPERFGDKLGSIRPMMSELYKTHQSQEGLDVERYGSAYRSLVPIFDFPEFGMQVVGAVEVGFGLLPKTKKHDAQKQNVIRPNSLKIAATNAKDLAAFTEEGHAVLLNAHFANDILWTEARQKLVKQSGSPRGQWLIESATSDALKNWQEKGLFIDPFVAIDQPQIISDANHHFLVTVFQPAFFTPTTQYQTRSSDAASSAKLLLASWSDITPEFDAYKSNQKSIWFTWIIAALIAEFGLWILFSMQNRRVTRLLREHSLQLKKERDSSTQSEQRLILALASSDSGFWEWDIANNRANFSRQWREMCGLSGDESSSGDMEDWLERIHPSDKRASYDAMIRHVKGETPMFENEYRLRVADGSYKWIFTRGKVVEWQPDGKAALMLGVYTDVTERKKNEITVIRQQGALHALNEIAAIPSLEAEDQLRRALVVGSQYLGLSKGIISCIHGNQYQNQIQVSNGHARIWADTEALSDHFCEYTFRNQDIFFIDDVAASEYVGHRAHSLNHLQSYIGVPIYLKGKIYGTLNFSSDAVRTQVYDNLDKDFMWLMSRWVSVTLERWQYQNEQKSFIERFNKLSNQLPGFLYQFQIDPDGRRFCPYSSTGIFEIFGVAADEALESAEKLFSRIHKDDLVWIEQTIKHSQETMSPWIANFRVNNRVRGELWVHAKSRPEKLSNGAILWHGILIDVTDAKHLELQLRGVNELSEAIFEAANMSIISTDKTGLIKTFNRGAEKLLGYKASEVINIVTPFVFHLQEEVLKHAAQLESTLPASPSANFHSLIEKMAAVDGSECDCTYKCKDGRLVSVSLSFTRLLNANKEVTGYLIVGRDISDIKRAEGLKNELISTVSHALRTPLTAISGSLGILSSGAAGELPETASRLLKIAHNNSQRLTHLTNDLLDLEKLSSGVMDIHLEVHSLKSLLELTQESLIATQLEVEDQAQLKSQVRVVDYPDEDIFVYADSQRFQQMMDNFLSNAYKFSPPNSPIEIKVTTQFNRVRIAIEDQGIGVSESFRPRLFEKFAQADDLEVRLRSGSGLGLAINKEIAERTGATIGYEPGVAQGSIFYVEMDYANSAEEALHFSAVGQWTDRILVAEQDLEIADLLTIMLRTYHYRVDTAHSGMEALEKLSLHHYQAVILGADLPDRDGNQLVNAIKRDLINKQIPLILLSNAHYEQERKKRLDPLFKDIEWLPKPPSVDELMSCLHKVIQKTEAQ